MVTAAAALSMGERVGARRALATTKVGDSRTTAITLRITLIFKSIADKGTSSEAAVLIPKSVDRSSGTVVGKVLKLTRCIDLLSCWYRYTELRNIAHSRHQNYIRNISFI